MSDDADNEYVPGAFPMEASVDKPVKPVKRTSLLDIVAPVEKKNSVTDMTAIITHAASGGTVKVRTTEYNGDDPGSICAHTD